MIHTYVSFFSAKFFRREETIESHLYGFSFRQELRHIFFDLALFFSHQDFTLAPKINLLG